MVYKNLIIEKYDDHITIVKFNRPDKLNTLTPEFMSEIEQMTEDFHKDVETRVVIFTGEGKHFCVGIDLLGQEAPKTLLGRQRNLDAGPRMIKKLQNMDQITIAAVNGGAFGGGACIAAALDIRIGEENCQAGFPECKLGMNLSWNILPIIVHLIGPVYAKEMTILAKNNNADLLLKWGFISEIVSKEHLINRAIELAKEYAAMPPIPAQMIKKSINHISSCLDGAIMHMDMDQNLLTTRTKDFSAGVAAFFAKKRGEYKGN